MSLDPILLRRSFELVVDRQPQLTRRFYEVLFTRFPESKPLFAGASMDRQMQMLQEALVAVLDHLEDASWLAATLGGLGKKHVGYGVTPEMYAWVGESLVATLAESAGSEWSPETERAWVDAYGAITHLMLEGAEASP